MCRSFKAFAMIAALLVAFRPALAAAPDALSAAANQAFVAANAKKDGVISRPSGLQYRVLHSGVGKHPGPTDLVQVSYSGQLINGTVFDGTSPGLPTSFTVDGVIPGLNEALRLMHEGDRWQIVVPAGLGFGPRVMANGAIPANQTLIFDLTLISTSVASKSVAPDTTIPLSIATAGRQQSAVWTIHP